MSEDFQLTFEDDPLARKHQEAFPLIRRGEFAAAWQLHEEILSQGVNHPDLFAVMKCLKFWLNRQPAMDRMPLGSARAEMLQLEWKAFLAFLATRDMGSHPVVACFKEAIYNQVVASYLEAYQKAEVPDPDMLLHLAAAFLEVGQVARARDTLLYARRFKPRDVQLHVLLGDTWFLLGEADRSVASYREAFFLAPKLIRIEAVQNPLIRELAKATEARGFRGLEVNLWLPIFAEIGNAFHAKRRMGDEEARRVERAMYELEVEFELRRGDRGEMEAPLLNHYLRLLDHWGERARNGGEEGERQAAQKVPALLARIKNVNETIYQELRSHYA